VILCPAWDNLRPRTAPNAIMSLLRLTASAALLASLPSLPAAEPREISGIYPHLAMYNSEGECGTGAVVPWADRLWAITYAPHKPTGSSDKLYEIDSSLAQTVRSESVGGTPANRMIHPESEQLFIGPYVIGKDRNVRVITPQQMFGRHTGLARHLADPAGKIVFATMEEGFYEVDVKSLAVTELWADEQRKTGRHAELPGYHGKGFYSAQGRYVYANNGDHAREALKNPAVPSGVLAEWDGKADAWTVVRRNQFTDVTGPGGITGNAKPEDPLWTIGWDHRSLILMLLDGGKWSSFRLPKASHSYDGAHGWNTEWPRIRDIGEPELLMTMHGMFWKFPKTFSAKNTAGLAPRSRYVKVVGDFCRWNDRVVLGCDDAAKSEFLNKRAVKGSLVGPGQSHSNLWFVPPAQLDSFGPPAGTGAVWVRESVKAAEPSDAFLFSGFAQRGLHLAHDSAEPVTFTFEIDSGNGAWRKLRDVTVPARGYQWVEFAPAEQAAWVRLRAGRDLASATAVFHYATPDPRSREAAPIFHPLAPAAAQDYSGGVMLSRGEDLRTMHFAASIVKGGKVTGEAYYELDANLSLRRKDDAKAHEWLKKNAAVPRGVISADDASVLVVDDSGKRWRLPKGDPAFGAEGALPLRVDREICTERDLFNAHGSFYELPAENAGGFAKIRPITTHNRRITDYCSYRGLLILSGLTPVADVAKARSPENPHLLVSDDGQCALWAGAVDDLWKLGKPAGLGGPWHDTAVTAGQSSDPYLIRGYDKKSLALTASKPASILVEVDITGNGDWHPYRTFTVKPGEKTRHDFPAGFSAYWVRTQSNTPCQATAEFLYE
jgi:hypothetical protein